MRAWVSARLGRSLLFLAAVAVALATLGSFMLGLFGHILGAVKDLLMVALLAIFLLWALCWPLNRKGKGGSFKA